MITDFIAIDFETANNKRTSAVSIGIVPVVDGAIEKEKCKHFLICPPENNFHELNVGIHGITWEDVKDAPSFKELWDKELGEILDNKLIICHNASMDKAILEQTLALYGIDSHFQILDTMNIAMQFYDFEDNKLATICDKFGICLDNQHHALCDAKACAEVAIKMLNDLGDKADNFIQSTGATSVQPSKFEKMKMTHQKIISDNLKPDFESVENKDNPFYKKKVVISGTYDTWPDRNELAQIVKSLGADIDTGITGKTNILIAGKGVGPKKMEKMQANIDAGKDAVILDENQIIDILNENGLKIKKHITEKTYTRWITITRKPEE